MYSYNLYNQIEKVLIFKCYLHNFNQNRIIIILLIDNKTFLKKGIRPNAIIKYKIYANRQT